MWLASPATTGDVITRSSGASRYRSRYFNEPSTLKLSSCANSENLQFSPRAERPDIRAALQYLRLLLDTLNSTQCVSRAAENGITGSHSQCSSPSAATVYR